MEEDCFRLDMERLNDTLAEPFPLHKGDTIDVGVVRIAGDLAITIVQDAVPPYKTDTFS